MRDIKLIALDLDGTLLNSEKELTGRSRVALANAAAHGIYIVPTTGRFYDAMPAAIRALPFVEYAITINGACVERVLTGEVLYHAEIPYEEALTVMELLDRYPVIYDCYTGSKAFMTASMQENAADYTTSPHYLKMVRELRQPVPELKAFVKEQKSGIQKIQFLTRDLALKKEIWAVLAERFPQFAISAAIPENVEINHGRANKGEALLALANILGLTREQTMSFGDGINDLPMIRAAGTGVAMANAEPEVLTAADMRTASCDEDGVAAVIETLLP